MIENLPGEEWRDVVGYEGRYQVSNKGRVKSFVRGAPRIMSPALCKVGRGYWTLRLTKDKKAKGFFVHRLVMLAFQPIDNPDEMEVNHKSFDTRDASLENLEWVTPQGNVDHYWQSDAPKTFNEASFGENGFCIGSNHHLSRLTDGDVLEIRRVCATKKHGAKIAIARKFNLHISTVSQIVSGKTWRHLLPSEGANS